jgi:hypothetical protein
VGWFVLKSLRWHSPLKIKSIIELLQRIAVDTDYLINEENPFRQVIINTHSPLVVSIVPSRGPQRAVWLIGEIYKCVFKNSCGG